MSKSSPVNQYLAALASGNMTPATLQKHLLKLGQELDDAVYFNYPKSDIDAIQKDILDIQEALAAGVGEFELGLRQRHASYKPEPKSPGYRYGPKEAGFVHKEYDDDDDEEDSIRAALGYVRQDTSSINDQLIKDLEKQLTNIRYDLQDAIKFREPKHVVDRLNEDMARVAKELETARTRTNPPRRRNGKYFSKKPTDPDGRLIGRPYSRGILKREMETHPTMRSRMVGLIRWAGEKHGVSLRDATIKKMLGKGAKDLPLRLRDIKRLADKAFYAGMRTMHALPGTAIVEPEPAKGRRGKKTKVGKKKRRAS